MMITTKTACRFSAAEWSRLEKCLEKQFNSKTAQKIRYRVERELHTFRILDGGTSRAAFAKTFRDTAKVARRLVAALDREWIKNAAFSGLMKDAELMEWCKDFGINLDVGNTLFDGLQTAGDYGFGHVILSQIKAIAKRCDLEAKALKPGKGRKYPFAKHRLITRLTAIWIENGGSPGTTENGPLVRFVQTAAGFVINPEPGLNQIRHRIRASRASTKQKK